MSLVSGLNILLRQINRDHPGCARVERDHNGNPYSVHLVVHGVDCRVSITYPNGIYAPTPVSLDDRYFVVTYVLREYSYDRGHDLLYLVRWAYENVMSKRYEDLVEITLGRLNPELSGLVRTDPLAYVNYRFSIYEYFVREYARCLIA